MFSDTGDWPHGKPRHYTRKLRRCAECLLQGEIPSQEDDQLILDLVRLAPAAYQREMARKEKELSYFKKRLGEEKKKNGS